MIATQSTQEPLCVPTGGMCYQSLENIILNNLYLAQKQFINYNNEKRSESESQQHREE